MKPDKFKLVESPCLGAFVATVCNTWVIKFDAVDDSDDDFIGIPTFNVGPPFTALCSITISASVLDPLNI